MIENLQELSSNATNFATASLTELKECTETNQGLLSTGTCLSSIAIRTELKGAVYLTQSGLLVSFFIFIIFFKYIFRFEQDIF